MDEAVSKGSRSGVVAIVGRPSAGKSSFLNAACGHKVAIVSRVPQTTRNRIRGIVNRDASQLIFIDTPGYHESTRTFNRHMRGLIEETIRDSEAILYLIDGSRAPGDEELALVELVRAHDLPRVVAINKIDVAKRRVVGQIRLLLEQRLPDVTIVEISAKTGAGIDELLARLFEAAPEGEPVYPDDFYTDQPPDFRVAEVIREKAMSGMRQELPHSIYVHVEDMEAQEANTDAHEELGVGSEGEPDAPPRRPNGDRREGRLWIRAFIYVERESQKGMLVGTGGSGIRRIRKESQAEIASLFPYRIELDLRVKVDPNWRKNDRVLDRLVT